MSKFSPGKSGNPSGRPRGSKNRADAELKKWVEEFVNSQKRQFQRDLKALSPYQRAKIMEKLFQYVLPKKQAVTLDEELKLEYAELERLMNLVPDEALERLEEKIVKFLELKKDE